MAINGRLVLNIRTSGKIIKLITGSPNIAITALVAYLSPNWRHFSLVGSVFTVVVLVLLM